MTVSWWWWLQDWGCFFRTFLWWRFFHLVTRKMRKIQVSPDQLQDTRLFTRWWSFQIIFLPSWLPNTIWMFFLFDHTIMCSHSLSSWWSACKFGPFIVPFNLSMASFSDCLQVHSSLPQSNTDCATNLNSDTLILKTLRIVSRQCRLKYLVDMRLRSSCPQMVREEDKRQEFWQFLCVN